MHTQNVARQALLVRVHDYLSGASWCCSWPIKSDVTYAVGNLISGSCTFTSSIYFTSNKAKVVGTAKVLCCDRCDTVLS